MKILKTIVAGIILFSASSLPQDDVKELQKAIEKLDEKIEHRFDKLEKSIDDIIWYQRVGDAAFIDKVFLTGPPLWKEKNPDGQGAGNPVKFWAYIFIPKDIKFTEKYPLIVFPHGGVHSHFSTYYTHIIRELIAQQYIVVAADYRGSAGYGKEHYEKIDYGGFEVEDVDSSRNFMIANYEFVDKDRVGIIGWSHGGLISLMNIFKYPDNYKVCFAGVPVSDLIMRMGYKDQSYRDLFEANYHIGQTAEENVEEYKRRSPVWYVENLKTPLLIHTNTNDEDVNVIEVESLINALKAAGKDFQYEIFQDLPGGHSFDRLDTKLAKEIRMKIYFFLAKYLSPPRKFKDLRELEAAAYY